MVMVVVITCLLNHYRLSARSLLSRHAPARRRHLPLANVSPTLHSHFYLSTILYHISDQTWLCVAITSLKEHNIEWSKLHWIIASNSTWTGICKCDQMAVWLFRCIFFQCVNVAALRARSFLFLKDKKAPKLRWKKKKKIRIPAGKVHFYCKSFYSSHKNKAGCWNTTRKWSECKQQQDNSSYDYF